MPSSRVRRTADVIVKNYMIDFSVSFSIEISKRWIEMNIQQNENDESVSDRNKINFK